MNSPVLRNDENSNLVPQFLKNAGEMGGIILNYPWTDTPVGAITEWPQSLRTTLGIILHSAFPMFLFWGEERTCFYNDAYRPSLGTSGKHPAIGKPAKEVWLEVWELTNSLINQVYATRKPQRFDDMLVPINRNGRIEDVYWTFSYSPVFGDDDEVQGILVTCMETTREVIARLKIEEKVASRTIELQEANNSIKQANHYLQEIVNSFRQPLQILEPVFDQDVIVDFKFKLTNQAYASYAATTPEQIQGKRVSEVFPGYLQTTSFSNVVRTYLTGESETWMIHYDQDGLDLYNEMTAIKTDGEIILHFADYTKLKYLELELLNKIKELESSNQNLEAFAHAASHDLKEPVRKIQIYADRLRTHLAGQLTDRDFSMFDKILSSSHRMGKLIDDLLIYSQFSLTPIEMELVDLNENVAQVIEDLEISIQEINASITLSKLPVVNGYKRQLQQLFQNLISNALKYHNPAVRPRIEISSKTGNANGTQYHQIEIRDNGIGFEQEFAEQIFQLFTRLHPGSDHRGSGVGLSTARKVADNHKGFISAESQPGAGALFRVLLPVN